MVIMYVCIILPFVLKQGVCNHELFEDTPASVSV